MTLAHSEGIQPVVRFAAADSFQSQARFDLQGERFIRDIRTNVRTVQIKEVMEKGQLDDFILAFLEQEEAAGTWEDRFPPTFPY